MKKIFSLILSIILSLSLCTSCTPKTQEAELPLGFYQSSKAAEYGEFRYIGITLSEDNKCEISFSMTGDFFYGTYEVKDTALICKLTTLQGEYIKTKTIDLEYHFKIVNDAEIEFEKALGTVGNYIYTIDGTEYDFENQFSHFGNGEKFSYCENPEE